MRSSVVEVIEEEDLVIVVLMGGVCPPLLVELRVANNRGEKAEPWVRVRPRVTRLRADW